MTRGTLIPLVSFAAVIAAVAVVATGRDAAAEQRIAGVQVISSDATARSVSLGVNKSLVIELPTDIKDVLVSNEKIVNAIMRSKRRVLFDRYGRWPDKRLLLWPRRTADRGPRHCRVGRPATKSATLGE